MLNWNIHFHRCPYNSLNNTWHTILCVTPSSGELLRTPWRVSVPRRGTWVNETHRPAVTRSRYTPPSKLGKCRKRVPNKTRAAREPGGVVQSLLWFIITHFYASFSCQLFFTRTAETLIMRQNTSKQKSITKPFITIFFTT